MTATTRTALIIALMLGLTACGSAAPDPTSDIDKCIDGIAQRWIEETGTEPPVELLVNAVEVCSE